jgi:hypothetical protein
MSSPTPSGPFLTGRAFVRHIQQKFLTGFTHSRFRKDRAKKKAPEPAVYFGNRELFTEDQAPPYVESMVIKKAAVGRSKA